MPFGRTIIAIVATFAGGCCTGSDTYYLDYELRGIVDRTSDHRAEVEVVATGGSLRTGGAHGEQASNGTHQTLLVEGSDRYGIVVQADPATADVFVLPLHCHLHAQDWSNWVGPTYATESTDRFAWLRFLHEAETAHTNIDPATEGSMRFKLRPFP